MSASSTDLAVALWQIGGYLLVLAAIAGIVVWVGRRRGSRTIVINVTLTLAAVWVGLFVLAAPIALSQTLGSPTVSASGIPVVLDTPAQFACDGSPTAADGPTLECVYGSTVSGTFTGLTAAPRLVIALGQTLAAIVSAAPAAAIAIICFQLLRGVPFTRVASRTLFATALVVLIAGIGADIASSIGASLAVAETLPAGDLAPEPRFSLTVEMWPFGAALALAALAAVFRHGERLQHETDGLV